MNGLLWTVTSWQNGVLGLSSAFLQFIKGTLYRNYILLLVKSHVAFKQIVTNTKMWSGIRDLKAIDYSQQLFLPPELNRCHLDLCELNRLIQSMQALEAGQAITNGDLKRIISIQVDFLLSLEQPLQYLVRSNSLDLADSPCFFVMQNLSLEKPKKPRSGKMWGHSRTLSRVEALGMVRMIWYVNS